MLKIQGIDHIVLRTLDTHKMADFYCNVLGCTIDKIQADIGLTHLRAGDQLIDLLQVKRAPNPSGFNLEHICLRMAAVDDEVLKNYFIEKGIEIYRFGHRYGAQGYGNSFYLKDPDGNEVEIVMAKNSN